MPLLIRETVAGRLRNLPALVRCLEDFHAATGFPVHFVTPLGNREAVPLHCGLCARMAVCAEGRRHCTRFLQQLLEGLDSGQRSARCDAGLWEMAVPLGSGGQVLGYLVFGYAVDRPPSRADFNGARHLLGRLGIGLSREELQGLLEAAPVLEPGRREALGRLLALLAERLLQEMTHHLARPEAGLPELIERACQLVRAGHTRELSLGAVAEALHISEGHLSRLFHQSTGLRFVEYVARVRVEHARERLQRSQDSVAEIAFACGFQSLSQFNRTVHAHFGCSPSQLREKGRLARGE